LEASSIPDSTHMTSKKYKNKIRDKKRKTTTNRLAVNFSDTMALNVDGNPPYEDGERKAR
jgi:hypothetical protein